MNSDIFKFLGGFALAVLVALIVPLLPIDGNVLTTDSVAARRDGSECGSIYRVAPGDTLHKIAVQAYGTGDYQTIFQANRHVLASTARIEIDDELFIPCRDGSGAQTIAALLARPTGSIPGSTPGSIPGATEATPGGDVRFVTGSDFAPFVHASSPQGGMVAEMIELAMSDGPGGAGARIETVEDWNVHLDLLQSGRFDLGFPWYRPDCARARKLGPSMRQRCDDFDFSDPLFEVAVGYYTLAGDPLSEAASYDQLAGLRICRPANFFTFDLEQEDLAGPETALVIVPELTDCFTRLLRGEVEVVSLARPMAEDEITRLGLSSEVVEITALASVQTLHAVAPRSDPDAAANLARLNQGLAGLQSSGRWFEVAARHFSAYGVRIR